MSHSGQLSPFLVALPFAFLVVDLALSLRCHPVLGLVIGLGPGAAVLARLIQKSRFKTPDSKVPSREVAVGRSFTSGDDERIQ